MTSKCRAARGNAPVNPPLLPLSACCRGMARHALCAGGEVNKNCRCLPRLNQETSLTQCLNGLQQAENIAGRVGVSPVIPVTVIDHTRYVIIDDEACEAN